MAAYRLACADSHARLPSQIVSCTTGAALVGALLSGPINSWCANPIGNSNVSARRPAIAPLGL